MPKVHESIVAAMSVIGSPAGPVCRVLIYDGSFKEGELEHAGTEYNFHGFAAGSLAVENEDARLPAWIGALKAGCDTAELAGITWACRWEYHSNVC